MQCDQHLRDRDEVAADNQIAGEAQRSLNRAEWLRRAAVAKSEGLELLFLNLTRQAEID